MTRGRQNSYRITQFRSLAFPIRPTSLAKARSETWYKNVLREVLTRKRKTVKNSWCTQRQKRDSKTVKKWTVFSTSMSCSKEVTTHRKVQAGTQPSLAPGRSPADYPSTSSQYDGQWWGNPSRSPPPQRCRWSAKRPEQGSSSLPEPVSPHATARRIRQPECFFLDTALQQSKK